VTQFFFRHVCGSAQSREDKFKNAAYSTIEQSISNINTLKINYFIELRDIIFKQKRRRIPK